MVINTRVTASITASVMVCIFLSPLDDASAIRRYASSIFALRAASKSSAGSSMPSAARACGPALTFRPIATDCWANLIMRREVGPLAVSGFSMKTFSPFSIAQAKCTQRNASGLAKIATSPGLRQSMAFR